MSEILGVWADEPGLQLVLSASPAVGMRFDVVRPGDGGEPVSSVTIEGYRLPRIIDFIRKARGQPTVKEMEDALTTVERWLSAALEVKDHSRLDWLKAFAEVHLPQIRAALSSAAAAPGAGANDA